MESSLPREVSIFEKQFFVSGQTPNFIQMVISSSCTGSPQDAETAQCPQKSPRSGKSQAKSPSQLGNFLKTSSANGDSHHKRAVVRLHEKRKGTHHAAAQTCPAFGGSHFLLPPPPHPQTSSWQFMPVTGLIPAPPSSCWNSEVFCLF